MIETNCKITNRETGETFYTTEACIYEAKTHTRVSEYNRIVRAAKSTEGFETYQDRFEKIKAEAVKQNKIMTEQDVAEKIAFDSDWRNHPATQRQINFLYTLGVKNFDTKNLTKGQASQMIELVKSEGLDALGQFDDGSEGLQFIGEVY